MVNKVILIGRLGKDPEIRQMKSGDDVASFSLATSETWKDKNTGERRDKTEWHNVVVFGNLTKVVKNWVKKGSQLYIEGKLQTRKWQDQSGNDRYTTEIVLQGHNCTLTMLGDAGGGKKDNSTTDSAMYGVCAQQAQPIDYKQELDDDIPF